MADNFDFHPCCRVVALPEGATDRAARGRVLKKFGPRKSHEAEAYAREQAALHPRKVIAVERNHFLLRDYWMRYFWANTGNFPPPSPTLKVYHDETQ